MKKQKLLLTLLVFVTFIGGFYSGIFFSNHPTKRNLSVIEDEAPKTAKKKIDNEE